MQRPAKPFQVGSIPILASNPLRNAQARVAESVDAADLKSADRKVMPVRLRPRAPNKSLKTPPGHDGNPRTVADHAIRIIFA